ncbi:MAG: tetratricopeptide repeat protein [Salibacteraceae bacterium]
MRMGKKYGGIALIIASIWLTYGSTLWHGYAGDDVIVITQNDRVQDGLSDIPSFFKNIKSDQTQHRYGYRPITLITYAAEVEFFGLNPFWHHFFNLVLYTILCLLIYYLIGLFFPSAGGIWALLTVLIFALHPLHVEVVANIKSRDEILAMLFGMLFLLAIFRWLDKPSNKLFTLAIILGVLGFLSKENAIGYVLVGGLLPWIKPFDTKIRLRGLFPTIITIAVLIGIYFASQYSIESNVIELFEQGRYHEDRFAANPLLDHGLGSRILNAFMIILLTMKLFIVPHPMVHDYGYQYIAMVQEFWDYRWILGLLLLTALIWLGYYLRRQQPAVLFGSGFFILTILIYLHVPIPGLDFFGERFAFGPLLGLSLVTVSIGSLVPKRIGLIILAMSLIPLGVLSSHRAADWDSTLSLFKADEPYLEHCARFHYNYAIHLHYQYYQASTEQQKMLRLKFMHHYERALEITDRMVVAFLDLGSAYMEFGEPEKAKLVFEQCAERYDHLSTPYYQLGQFYFSQENFASALIYYEKALERGKSNPVLYYMKAICQLKLGDLQAARDTLESGWSYGKENEKYLELMRKLNVAKSIE